jgi:hypothetical protein
MPVNTPLREKIKQLFPNRKRITNAQLMQATVEAFPSAKERIEAFRKMAIPKGRDLRRMPGHEFDALFEKVMGLVGNIPSRLVPEVGPVMTESYLRRLSQTSSKAA